MKIVKKEATGIPYRNLQPGDVFRLGTNLKAKGLKVEVGYVHLENVCGEPTFRYMLDFVDKDTRILREGRLTGLEVE